MMINEMIEREDAEKDTSEDESEEEDHDKHWDCQSIISTYTNTDNHPAIIKTTSRVVRTKQRMEMHKQFKVPLDGLMAEEISIKPVQAAKKEAAAGPYVEKEAEKESESGDEDDKAGRKKKLKEEKREKRKLKKQLKIAFTSQNSKIIKQTTAEVGALRVGVSVKKIY